MRLSTREIIYDQINLKTRFAALAILSVINWTALALYLWTGNIWLSGLLLYTSVYIVIGLGLYLLINRKHRDMARRLMFVLMGTLLLFLSIASNHGNMQIEGLFFAVMAGGGSFVILHYALAKILGPLIFGRVWCGWACWFGMVFDLLPYPHSRYRIPGRWTWLRYVHLGLSLGVIALLVYGYGYHSGIHGTSGLLWFGIGLGSYYGFGIGLALWLKDNRAFCKYMCPIAPLQKVGTKFALLRVSGDGSKCGECIACMELCPMNIDIKRYITQGERVLSTECTLCQTCINVCPHQSLQLSFGLDVGGKEYIDFVPPKPKNTVTNPKNS